ncbi:MAG TPA: hypothetical protein VLW50_31235 [Streptosporangiaceae bacterium]|nr:hypothetical protein [Streptosporangiaceae bacterium]
MPPCPSSAPEAGHPDAAGWVLGSLDAADAAAFEEHLRTCALCQAAVADFESLAMMMDNAAPGAVPPPGLGARTVAAVTKASRAKPPKDARTGQAGRTARHHWNFRLLSLAGLAGAAVGAAAIFIAAALTGGGSQSFTIPLHGASGSAASGQAIAHHIDGGFSIDLTVAGLPKLGPNRFYECVYAGPKGPDGKPQLITAGSFAVTHSGATTLHMTSAADPRAFPVMEIVAKGPGPQQAKVVLSGTAS